MSKVQSLLALLLCLSPGLSWASPTSGQVDSPGVYSNDIVLPNPEGPDQRGVDVTKQQESQAIDGESSGESSYVKGQDLHMNGNKIADVLGACLNYSCYMNGMALLRNEFSNESDRFQYYITGCGSRSRSITILDCFKKSLKYLKGIELGPMSVSELGQFIQTVCDSNNSHVSEAACYRGAISHRWVPPKIKESVSLCADSPTCYSELMSIVK